MRFILSAGMAVDAAELLIVHLLMIVKNCRSDRNGLWVKLFQP
jgi:hypothetical protein